MWPVRIMYTNYSHTSNTTLKYVCVSVSVRSIPDMLSLHTYIHPYIHTHIYIYIYVYIDIDMCKHRHTSLICG